jgi:hypothetical protein
MSITNTGFSGQLDLHSNAGTENPCKDDLESSKCAVWRGKDQFLGRTSMLDIQSGFVQNDMIRGPRPHLRRQLSKDCAKSSPIAHHWRSIETEWQSIFGNLFKSVRFSTVGTETDPGFPFQ